MPASPTSARLFPCKFEVEDKFPPFRRFLLLTVGAEIEETITTGSFD